MTPSRFPSRIWILIAVLAGVGAAHAETPVALSLVDATAPAETVGCLQVLVAGEDQAATEEALAYVGGELLKAARDALIPRVGHPFVLGLAPGQVKGVYPLRLEYCQPVSETVPSRLTYRMLASRKMRIGYCGSPDRDRCQAALSDALGNVDGGGSMSSIPVVRNGVWTRQSPPGANEMIENVFALQDTFAVPLDAGTGKPDGAASLEDAAPRPLGQIPTSDQGPPPPGPGAAAGAPKGFVFAVSDPH